MSSLSIALLMDLFVVLSSLILVLHIGSLHAFEPSLMDLDLFYVAWVLVALVFIRLGYKRSSVIHLGWWMGGLTFALHGFGKLYFAGDAWLSGEVVRNILWYGVPSFAKSLSAYGALDSISAAAGCAVIGRLLSGNFRSNPRRSENFSNRI